MISDGKRQEALDAKENIKKLVHSLMALQSGDNGEIPGWLDDATHELRMHLGRYKDGLEHYLKDGR